VHACRNSALQRVPRSLHCSCGGACLPDQRAVEELGAGSWSRRTSRARLDLDLKRTSDGRRMKAKHGSFLHRWGGAGSVSCTRVE